MTNALKTFDKVVVVAYLKALALILFAFLVLMALREVVYTLPDFLQAGSSPNDFLHLFLRPKLLHESVQFLPLLSLTALWWAHKRSFHVEEWNSMIRVGFTPLNPILITNLTLLAVLVAIESNLLPALTYNRLQYETKYLFRRGNRVDQGKLFQFVAKDTVLEYQYVHGAHRNTIYRPKLFVLSSFRLFIEQADSAVYDAKGSWKWYNQSKRPGLAKRVHLNLTPDMVDRVSGEVDSKPLFAGTSWLWKQYGMAMRGTEVLLSKQLYRFSRLILLL